MDSKYLKPRHFIKCCKRILSRVHEAEMDHYGQGLLQCKPSALVNPCNRCRLDAGHNTDLENHLVSLVARCFRHGETN